MEIWQVAILGLVQGASEFLPISSTAHLILVPYFFNWPDLGLAFDVALHLGTLLAVLIFFWKEWRGLLANRKLLTLLILVTIPAIFFGPFLSDKAETVFREPIFVAFNLAFWGIVLWVADFLGKKAKDWEKLGKMEVVLVGIFQAMAILPGVSRSGATMTGGLLLGLTREAAVKFSFLASAPIILASVVWEGRKLLGGVEAGGSAETWMVGVSVSFFSGYLAIKFLLKFVQNHSLWPFVVYRLILALIIISSLLARG